MQRRQDPRVDGDVMTGLGRVYFDAVRIETLVRSGGPGQVNLETRSKPRTE